MSRVSRSCEPFPDGFNLHLIHLKYNHGEPRSAHAGLYTFSCTLLVPVYVYTIIYRAHYHSFSKDEALSLLTPPPRRKAADSGREIIAFALWKASPERSARQDPCCPQPEIDWIPSLASSLFLLFHSKMQESLAYMWVLKPQRFKTRCLPG